MTDAYRAFFETPEGLSTLRTILRFAKAVGPFLAWFGIKPEQVEDMLRQSDDLLKIPAFNEIFLDRGWAAHRWLSVPHAVEALDHAKAHRWDAANQTLVRAYSPQTIRANIGQLSKLRSFSKRRRLALLALGDYEARRFHACVPIVLTLIDGMGQELTGQGFLRQGVRFAKADSFLEIGPGVTSLIRKMTESRGHISEQPLDFPYRHGILHGSDLCYDNEIVAAKAWGVLLAVGSCALDIEMPLPSSPPRGLMEELLDYSATCKRIDEVRRHLDTWQPRQIPDVLAAAARVGPAPNTPEAAACQLIEAWQARNYGAMAKLSTDVEKVSVNAAAGRIRQNVGGPPTSFGLIDIEDQASAAAWVVIRAKWDDDLEEDLRLRMLFLANGETKPRTMGPGRWLVHSLWPLEAAALRIAARECRTEYAGVTERGQRIGAVEPSDGGQASSQRSVALNEALLKERLALLKERSARQSLTDSRRVEIQAPRAQACILQFVTLGNNPKRRVLL